jgi:hypothetical protein
LFESIEGFVEMEDFAWESRVYKPCWLEDVDVEIALSVEKGVFTIDVVSIARHVVRTGGGLRLLCSKQEPWD